MGLTRLGIYGSTTEAELVRARLEANGIVALVQADNASGTVPPLGTIEGIKVLVREEDLADAYEALERMLPAGD
jgi:hypothetical protein